MTDEVLTAASGEAESAALGLIDGYREARLDNVIAQELHADAEFATWLWQQAGGDSRGTLVGVDVRMNEYQRDADFPADAQGETDVLAHLHWSDGTSSWLLIEDKIGAEFQPAQPERYRRRADAVEGRCLLIAPADYPVGEKNLASFHGRTSVEMVASWIDGRTSHSAWNAEMLRSLLRSARTPAEEHKATVQFTDYCVRWFEANAPHVMPQRSSLRTKKEGWLYFSQPKALIYKVVGVKAHERAMVDYYLDRGGVDPEAVRTKLQGTPCTVTVGSTVESAFLTTDSQEHAVLRIWVDKLAPTAGVEEHAVPEQLDLALHACAALADWVASVSDTDAGDEVEDVQSRALGRLLDVFDRPIIQNNFRSEYVEHLVGVLLGDDWRHVGGGWTGWDFEREGVRLEVKQSAARQSWTTSGPSACVFDIAPRDRYWNGTEFVEGRARHAHVYVLCWHPEPGEDADHRRADQWRFYVVPSASFPVDQKTISLSSVEALNGAVMSDWRSLARVVGDLPGLPGAGSPS